MIIYPGKLMYPLPCDPTIQRQTGRQEYNYYQELTSGDNAMKSPVFLLKPAFSFLVFILFLSACTTYEIIQEPVSEPGKRHEFEKFSILPPQGDNWFLVFSKEQSGKTLLMFGKSLGDAPLGIKSFQPHTVRAVVTAYEVGDEDVGSPEAFLAMTQQAEKANTTERFILLEDSYSLYKKVGEYCVLVKNHSEDHAVPEDPGKVYQFRYTSLLCYDRDTQLMIDATCSQRAEKMDDMINLEDECGPFLDSLKFNQ